MLGVIPGAWGERGREAALFRTVSATLRQVRPGQAARRARGLAEARRLWLAVETAVARPDCGLAEPLRRGLLLLGSVVLKELRAPSPDLGLLIVLNERMADGLAPRHGWEAAMSAMGAHRPLET